MKLRAMFLCAAFAAALCGGVSFAGRADAAETSAPLVPALVFADDMVLQADAPVAVFGSGENGRTVTVTLGGQSKSAPVENGRWRVTLDPMPASFAPQTMEIGDGAQSARYSGVLVGEVWFCSGQSNMELTLGALGSKAAEYDQTFDNFEKIRVMTVPYRDGGINNAPLPRMTWVAPASSADLRAHSAYAAAAALQLQKRLDVPVGVMVSAVGGSCIEEWLDPETVARTGSIAASMGKVDSRFYQNMAEFLTPYTVGGIFWYQGEANSSEQGTALYPAQFEGYAAMYRKIWGDVPVVYAQLPGYKQPDGAYWREFRDMQWKLMERVENVWAVCGIDLGNALDIHPTDKLPFGIRAGDLAAAKAYDKAGPGLSPYPAGISYAGNTVTVTYADGAGLTQKGEGTLAGFELLLGGVWQAVPAVLRNDTVTLTSAGKPAGVRYAWELMPEIALYNGHGLPAAAFTLGLTEKTYTVTVTAGEGGRVDQTVYTVAEGGKAVVAVTPDPGYEVISVKVDGKEAYYTGGAFTTPAVHADMTVEIAFGPVRERFTVTVTAYGDGTVTPQAGAVFAGETFSFTVSPAQGFTVASVRAGETELTPVDGVYSFTVTGDATVAVRFAASEKGCGAAAGTNAALAGGLLFAIGLAVALRRAKKGRVRQ